MNKMLDMSKATGQSTTREMSSQKYRYPSVCYNTEKYTVSYIYLHFDHCRAVTDSKKLDSGPSNTTGPSSGPPSQRVNRGPRSTDHWDHNGNNTNPSNIHPTSRAWRVYKLKDILHNTSPYHTPLPHARLVSRSQVTVTVQPHITVQPTPWRVPGPTAQPSPLLLSPGTHHTGPAQPGRCSFCGRCSPRSFPCGSCRRRPSDRRRRCRPAG